MMVDPWDCVDLTITCESDEGPSLAPDGEPVVNIRRLPVAKNSPAEVSPSLAQIFTDIYSRKCRENQARYGQESSSTQPRNVRQCTINQGDEQSEPILRIDSIPSIGLTHHGLHKYEKTQPSLVLNSRCPDLEKNGSQFEHESNGGQYGEVIEIDDDSNDQDPSDLPSCDDVSSGNESRYSTMQEPTVQDGLIMGSDSLEEVDIRNATNGKPPVISSELSVRAPEMSSPAPLETLPETPSEDENLVDTPQFSQIAESTPPILDSLGDGKHAENNSENIISIDSDNGRCLVPSPRAFYCMYCEYSTFIEEWYHEHVANHLPGTKPYLRMYCTECSYSTGTEKFLVFHMAKTHSIKNPEFYRSGEKRFTCRTCKLTRDLRSDIESHISSSHKSGKQRVLSSKSVKGNAQLKIRFQCVESGCARSLGCLSSLASHVIKRHKTTPSVYYRFAPQQKGRPFRDATFGCFSCGFKDPDRNTLRLHAEMHFFSGETLDVESGTTASTFDESGEMDVQEGEERLLESPDNQVALPEPHRTSPGHDVTSPTPHVTRQSLQVNSKEPYSSSPELQIVVSPPHPASPETGFLDGEQLADTPEDDEASSPPPRNSHLAEGECETDTIDSESDSDHQQVKSPRTFYCIYCEYSTVIEEWYHKHVTNHLPGTKPYLRIYCSECSYSTGSEKFLLFHMAKTHNIVNPEFYRSGEKRYTCRLCRHTQELRIDIESHIKKKHKSDKKALAKEKKALHIQFRCCEDDCDKYFKKAERLRLHVRKLHNVRFPLSYCEFSQITGRQRIACFCCNETLAGKLGVARHARRHYTIAQRRAPFVYKCPLRFQNVKCTFSCKNRSKITEHYRSVHSKDVKYYKKSERAYVCLNCHTVNSCLERMESHCTLYCRKC